MNYRPQRVQKLIREELGKIMTRELDVPASTLVTITEVEVDDKLDNAEIKVSVLPPEHSAEILKLLKAATGHLHHLLFKKINLRPMPLIRFEIDRGLENAAAVEKVLLKDNN